MKGTAVAKQDHVISSALSTTLDAVTPDQGNAHHLEYRSLGKRFAILSELWMWRTLLRCPCPTDLQSLGPWHPGQCANDAAWDEGIVAELYHLLPSPYHEFIENLALFSDEVCKNFSRHPVDLKNFFPVYEGCQTNLNLPHQQCSEAWLQDLLHRFQCRVLLYKL